ncbi:MAG: hypothetical protein R3338_14480, partial [Thermoanaerobaculia bacterium]|nr:hypothetical protein [Thermoanaerobaculia bacterium]
MGRTGDSGDDDRGVSASPRFPLATPLHLFVILLILAAISIALPLDSFWITDNGNRWIQMESLWRSGGEIWIDYPARPIDPSLHFFPRGGHHFLIERGKVASFYPTAYPAVAALLFPIFGLGTRIVLPLAGTLMLLSICVMISSRLELPRGPLLWLVAFATPICFYSLVFWEHTLATALAMAALWLAWRSHPSAAVMAGILLAGSTVLREEGYLFAAALLVWILLEKRWLKMAAFLAGLISILAIHWYTLHSTHGSILGPHVSKYVDLEGGTAPATKLTDYLVYLFQIDPDPIVNALLVLPYVAALIMVPSVARDAGTGRRKLFVSLLLLVIASGVWIAFSALLDPHPDLGTLHRQGFFPALPLALPATLGAVTALRGSNRLGASAGLIFLIVVAITPFFLHTVDLGIIWGPRHFFHLFPLTIFLSVIGFRRLAPVDSRERKWRVAFTVAVAGLIAVSILIQLAGLRTLEQKRAGSADLVDTVRSLDEELIVTDVYWMPEEI